MSSRLERMAASRLIKFCAGLMLLAGCGVMRAGEPASADLVLHTVSMQQFSADVQTLQRTVAACTAQASGCEAGVVTGDERVGEVEHGGFEVHWSWLRSALQKAKVAKPEDRVRLMIEARDHLQDLAQAGGSASDDKELARARREADSVLRASEFDGADGPTWWDRKLAQMQSWLAEIFHGVDRLGSMAPWLGKLLEWLLFLGAAVGLLVFLLRTLERQRMRVALANAAPMLSVWQRESDDWAAMVQRHADAAEWREAVHCLYWAAIVLLEGRRAWRHNPTRTPREYLRLLKPGTAQQRGLRGLTQIFERVWYGQREGDREAFERAQASFRQLESGAETTSAVPFGGAAGETA
jgi:hypothetical protein